jgi:hypothetical protein
VLQITRDRTRGVGDQEVRGLTALSSAPYELWTVDPKLKSLRDLDPQRNKIGLPAVKVSVPAIFLQMASEKINGVGMHAAFDALTVSLAQPDGVISLAAGGGTVRHRSVSRCAKKPMCTGCGRATSCSATRLPLSLPGQQRGSIATTPKKS